MLTHLKKIILTVLPLAGLLLTAPLTFAYASWGEQGRVHNELGKEHREGLADLNAEHKEFYRYSHSRRAHRREHRRLEREHQRLHQDLNVQHEDYHDGNRYRNWQRIA